jgi:hypothetical protein
VTAIVAAAHGCGDDVPVETGLTGRGDNSRESVVEFPRLGVVD